MADRKCPWPSSPEHMVSPWLGPSWPTWLVPGLCNNKKAETKLIFKFIVKITLVKTINFTVPSNCPDKALPEQPDSGALLTVSWATEKTSWPNSEIWVAVYGSSDPTQSLGRMKKPRLESGHLGSLDR